MDWLAGIFELIGLYVIGVKNKYGFLINILGNVAWIYVALTTGVYGLLLVVCPAIVLNTTNYVKWHRSHSEGV